MISLSTPSLVFTLSSQRTCLNWAVLVHRHFNCIKSTLIAPAKLHLEKIVRECLNEQDPVKKAHLKKVCLNLKEISTTSEKTISVKTFLFDTTLDATLITKDVMSILSSFSLVGLSGITAVTYLNTAGYVIDLVRKEQARTDLQMKTPQRSLIGEQTQKQRPLRSPDKLYSTNPEIDELETLLNNRRTSFENRSKASIASVPEIADEALTQAAKKADQSQKNCAFTEFLKTMGSKGMDLMQALENSIQLKQTAHKFTLYFQAYPTYREYADQIAEKSELRLLGGMLKHGGLYGFKIPEVKLDSTLLRH